MKSRNGILYYSVFAVFGTALALTIIMALVHFNKGTGFDSTSLARIRAMHLVDQMRLDLALASQNERSAVMAESDQNSRAYADQARAATSLVEDQRLELNKDMESFFTQKEKDLFAQFSQAFAEYQKVDANLLDMAVQNSNIKAYGLAFGPAAQSLQDMTMNLERLTQPNPGGTLSPEAVAMAYKAQVSALRIQALLAPHIAEVTDEKMDQLEAQMSLEDNKVRLALDGLTGLNLVQAASVVASAKESYARFCSIKDDILRLSRENTNVRSLSILFGQKLNIDSLCQQSLDTLEQTIINSLPKDTIITKVNILSK